MRVSLPMLAALLLLHLAGLAQEGPMVREAKLVPVKLVTGTIGTSPVRILIQDEQGPVQGLLFYEKTGVPFWVEGERKGDSLTLGEYLDEEAFAYGQGLSGLVQTGALSMAWKEGVDLAGEWTAPSGGRKLPIRLTYDHLGQPSPHNSWQRINAANSQMELLTLLACAFTGVDPSLLWIESMPEGHFYSDPEVPAHLVRPGEVQVSSMPFSAEGQLGQSLYRIGIRDFRVLFTSATSPVGSRSGLRTGHLLCAEVLWDQVWCLDEPDTSFVKHQVVKVCGGEPLLDLEVTTALCVTAGRGSEVQRWLFRLEKESWKEQTHFVQHSYWYSSPCPNPAVLPVDARAEYKTAKGGKWPTTLEITHVRYGWQKEEAEINDGCGPYEEELGTSLERVNLCR